MNFPAIAILALGVLLTPAVAHAYTDPGTGGLLVQLLTLGVAGAVVIVRLYWRQVKEWFGRRKG